MKKMGAFVWFPYFLPELWSLTFPKKYIVLQFCADLSKKPKSVKAIYIYDSFHYTLLEKDMIYRGLNHRSWDISNYNIKKDADLAGI